MKKEDLDADPQSMDNKRLSSIARNPNHPLHTHAKAELARRKIKKAEMDEQKVDEIEEKTLTPAEKRKREKIAKAIEKDNPDMPMDKKMAIATATAKRVAEGAYLKGSIESRADAHEDQADHHNQQAEKAHKAGDKTAASAHKAAARAHMKAASYFDKHLSKPAHLRPQAAGGATSQAAHAATQKANQYNESVAESKDDDYHKTLGQTKNSDEGIAALKKKHGMSHTKAVATLKRLMGEGKAYGPTGVSYYVPSGHKDEVNPKTGEKYPERQKPGYKNPSEQKVDELKKSTLASYIKKASDDRAKNAYDIGKSGKINYKGLKRRQGINRAVNKMANEENIDEVLDTPKAMQSYKDKAKYSKDRAANSAAAKILRGPDADGNRSDHSPELKTMAKRDKGLKMADKAAMRKTFKALRTR